MGKNNHLGADAGAKELVVEIDRNGVRESGLVFTNNEEGHQKLICRQTAPKVNWSELLTPRFIALLGGRAMLPRQVSFDPLFIHGAGLALIAKSREINLGDRRHTDPIKHAPQGAFEIMVKLLVEDSQGFGSTGFEESIPAPFTLLDLPKETVYKVEIEAWLSHWAAVRSVV